MAISTYAELQTAVGSWLERSSDAEVTAHVAEWIALAEARLNRQLVGLRKTTVSNTSLTGTASSRNISIAALAFLSPVSLVLTTDSNEVVLRPYVAGTLARSTVNGYPTAWAMNGDNIELDRPCDQAHTFVFRYHQALDIETDYATNWVLANYPDVYLFESLKQASIYFKDVQSAQGYGAIAQQAIDEIKTSNLRNDNSRLTVDPALLAGYGGLTLGDFNAGNF